MSWIKPRDGGYHARPGGKPDELPPGPGPVSGPQLDIDSIEARAQYVHATATGKPYALAEDARLLCAEVRQLRADKRRLEVAVEFRNRRIDELIGQSWAVTSTEPPDCAECGHAMTEGWHCARCLDVDPSELQRATEQQQ